MMVDKIANSKNDEWYTPEYAVIPIVKFLKKKNYKKIWSPFDTIESNFVKVLKKNGFSVINTHINNKEDFFKFIEMGKINCDCIVSNPPYSIKNNILTALFKSKKPFAMLLGIVGIFESQLRFELLKNNEFELLILNKRVDYFTSFSKDSTKKSPPFLSVYLTSKVLNNKIEFEYINKKHPSI